MKINWKSSFKIALILTAIASVGAVSIALTNVLTGPIIEKNRAEREQKGLKKVFGEDATFGEKVELSNEKYPGLKAFYPVTLSADSGRIYSVSGVNSYGGVSLLVGLYSDYSIHNIVVMENTESYATALNENYIEPLTSAENKDEALESVKCGATSGAKLIRDLVIQAKDHYKEGK